MTNVERCPVGIAVAALESVRSVKGHAVAKPNYPSGVCPWPMQGDRGFGIWSEIRWYHG